MFVFLDWTEAPSLAVEWLPPSTSCKVEMAWVFHVHVYCSTGSARTSKDVSEINMQREAPPQKECKLHLCSTKSGLSQFIYPGMIIYLALQCSSNPESCFVVTLLPLLFYSNSVNNLCHYSMSHFQMEDKMLFLLQWKILTADIRRCSDSYLNYMTNILH